MEDSLSKDVNLWDPCDLHGQPTKVFENAVLPLILQAWTEMDRHEIK